MDPILCKVSPYLHHTIQSIVIKEGKSNRIVWDGSTVLKPTDIAMNDITPVAKESPITFGHVKMQIFIDIYNMQISYPNKRILIALADIKACFWFARIHADLTGAFGFSADDLYNLATAMVFGSTTSASSWESFRQAIEALTIVFSNRSDLVSKHRRFLDMIQWDIFELILSLPSSVISTEASWMKRETQSTYQHAYMSTMRSCFLRTPNT